HRLLETDARQCDRVRGSLDEGIRSSGAKFEYITQQLGYLLGCDLYEGYLEGRVTPGFVRTLFLTHVEEPGTAREAYFTLVSRLRGGRRKAHRNGGQVAVLISQFSTCIADELPNQFDSNFLVRAQPSAIEYLKPQIWTAESDGECSTS